MIQLENKSIITPPPTYNYVALFLTLHCNLSCPYCINLNEANSSRKSVIRNHIEPEKWLDFIARLELYDKNGVWREDMPLTLQGGEPTTYKGFYTLVNGIPNKFKLDLLTNFMFNVDEFIDKIPASKFTRDAKYAAIRVSYHPGQNKIEDLIQKHHKMRDAGFYVGIYSVATPQNLAHIKEVQDICLKEGIDFRLKEYLGFDGKEWHGTYKYPEAISQNVNRFCECKTSELLIAPNGGVYRCHSDLYESRTPIGSILDPKFQIQDIYRPCFVYGHCNPCDIKVKTNRFQEFGHTSVDIKHIRDLTPLESNALANGDYGLGIEK
ncbi:radical SAM domain-containing protein [Helicobacter cinaedi CCUG 18818 = ATCC BAA-847]|uniref:Radical SAM domain-containing protein n=1 Tax=Helicobacter cinaedi CCUG 18818 = ATCC BAA-847 TaxID=537971 RepID=A0AAI8QH73_9HELI|nr:radical SAM protein [Helicobacter cinaedi]BAM32474.1 radical SAM domain-containing protein [Helicobacter cinaedi CCUG 18818 = ATCC BAA-847]